MPSRPDWVTHWLDVAELTAMRGTCSRLQVGCVLATGHNRIVSTGYNGGLSRHCDHKNGGDLRDNRCSNAVHAEDWALVVDLPKHEYVDAYLTHSPCSNCYKMLRDHGIRKIYYRNRFYRVPEGMDQDPDVIHVPVKRFEEF